MITFPLKRKKDIGYKDYLALIKTLDKSDTSNYHKCFTNYKRITLALTPDRTGYENLRGLLDYNYCIIAIWNSEESPEKSGSQKCIAIELRIETPEMNLLFNLLPGKRDNITFKTVEPSDDMIINGAQGPTITSTLNMRNTKFYGSGICKQDSLVHLIQQMLNETTGRARRRKPNTKNTQDKIITSEMVDYCRKIGNGDIVPEKPLFGLCQNFFCKFKCSIEELVDFTTYPEYSNAHAYPIQHPDLPPITAYFRYKDCLWDSSTVYGLNRRKFCLWFAYKLETLRLIQLGKSLTEMQQ